MPLVFTDVIVCGAFSHKAAILFVNIEIDDINRVENVTVARRICAKDRRELVQFHPAGP